MLRRRPARRAARIVGVAVTWVASSAYAFGAVASLVSLTLVVGTIAAVNGGYVYRVECPTPQGTTETEWTYRIMNILPYVGYSRPGCEVHTATRVALSKIGIWEITSSEIHLAAATYWFSVTTAIRSYAESGEEAEEVGQIRAAEEKLGRVLDGLTAPSGLRGSTGSCSKPSPKCTART